MKRLLCIVSSLNAGGAETFLMKIHRNIDRDNYQLDFCVMSEGKGVYEDEVLQRGGKIFRTVQKSKNPIKCFFCIKRIVKENGYNYVMRVNENSLSVIDLLASKAGGAKVLAMRSSNAASPGKIKTFLHKAFKFLPKTVPTVKIAPSTEAAEYTFGKDCVKNGKVKLLHNGLDYNTYKFDEDMRFALRKELGVSDNIVIGHVGRFSRQKNHQFLIDIFKSAVDLNENVRLALTGVGELEEEIKAKAKALGIDDKILFLGRRADVPKLMSAFDVLALPSLYEGMPNVVIEAQASGLACVISDTITPEADITGLVKYISLNKPSDDWAHTILDCANVKREDTKIFFTRKKYHLNQVTDRFIQLIFEGATD